MNETHAANAARIAPDALAWVFCDSKQQVLIAARDRLGISGLYYSIFRGILYVSNRVEQLLTFLPTSPPPNINSLVAQVHGEPPLPGESYYEGILALEPGHLLVASSRGVRVQRYWQACLQPLLTLPSDEAYADAYREVLWRVVNEHLSPGHVGITLSSGLDSSSVAAACRSVAPDVDITAFRWTTPELPESDEDEPSSGICRKLAIPSITVRADLHWPLSRSEGIKTSRASPFKLIYSEAWDVTFQLVRERGISVLYSGLGGDRLFGGNVFSYPDLLITGRWLELARQIREHLPHSPNNLNVVQIARQMVLGPIINTYFPYLRYRSRTQVPWITDKYKSLYLECFSPPKRLALVLPGRQQRLKSLQDRALPWIAEQVTSQASQYGIEFRHPLLDHRMVEFAASLPTSQMSRSVRRKIVVRNAMRGYLPRDILDAWDKIYPTAVAHRGLRQREQAKVWSLMTHMKASELGLVDESRLQRSYRDYLAGTGGERFWHTLALEDWLRRYF